MIFIIVNGIGIWRQEKTDLVFLLGMGVIGTIYLIAFNFFIIPALNFEPALGWINAMRGRDRYWPADQYALPDQSDIYLGILLITFMINMRSHFGTQGFVFSAVAYLASHYNHPPRTYFRDE